MPVSTEAKIALVAGSSAVIVGGFFWWATHNPPAAREPQGRLLCPHEVGKEPALRPPAVVGDFIVLQLQSPRGDFSESTWGSVVATSADALEVLISGEQVPEGVLPLRSEKHGFRLGRRLLVPRTCVWEIFRPAEHGGQILCGPKILDLATSLNDGSLFPVQGGLSVMGGDRAQIIVASKESGGDVWNEKLWTRISSVSPGGQVVTAVIEDAPELTPQHRLVQGSIVRYNRDCIIGV